MARAVDADKLGGYAASAYLRKDEVKNVTATYSETEWTTPGTYDWVVPEGVNKIQVTSVGGGGGVGFQYFVATNGTYSYNFSGGSGGEVIFRETHVTPGETLQIVVAARGANLWAQPYPLPLSIFQANNGRRGYAGGTSYVKRNNTIISETVARGGNGGSPNLPWITNNSNFPYHLGVNIDNLSSYPGAGPGAWLPVSYSNGYCGSHNASYAGIYGKGFPSMSYYKSNTDNYGPAGYYNYSSGGGSWGDGCASNTGADAGIGGGGCVAGIHGGNGFRQAGDGIVRIKAVGTVFN